MKKRVSIIDYGSGNWRSIQNSFKRIGCSCKVYRDERSLLESDLLVLPGVGAFKPAMKSIKEKRIDKIIFNHVEKGKTLLGICLGMQLLGISSSENGETRGLGLINSKVTSIGNQEWHIGWNTIELIKKDKLFISSNNKDYYFNHSYAYQDDGDHVLSITKFKDIEFASIIRSKNVIGVQFHPEKSQDSGDSLLHSIIESL